MSYLSDEPEPPPKTDTDRLAGIGMAIAAHYPLPKDDRDFDWYFSAMDDPQSAHVKPPPALRSVPCDQNDQLYPCPVAATAISPKAARSKLTLRFVPPTDDGSAPT